MEEGLQKLRTLPALIIWGGKDIAFREKERQRFAQLFPNNRMVLLAGAGHFIQEDAPEEVAAAIRLWKTG